MFLPQSPPIPHSLSIKMIVSFCLVMIYVYVFIYMISYTYLHVIHTYHPWKRLILPLSDFVQFLLINLFFDNLVTFSAYLLLWISHLCCPLLIPTGHPPAIMTFYFYFVNHWFFFLTQDNSMVTGLEQSTGAWWVLLSLSLSLFPPLSNGLTM